MELLSHLSEQCTPCLFTGLREVGGKKLQKDALLVCNLLEYFSLSFAPYVMHISFNFNVYIVNILDKWVLILEYLVSRY